MGISPLLHALRRLHMTLFSLLRRFFRLEMCFLVLSPSLNDSSELSRHTDRNENVNECMSDPCGKDMRCINIPGTFICRYNGPSNEFYATSAPETEPQHGREGTLAANSILSTGPTVVSYPEIYLASVVAITFSTILVVMAFLVVIFYHKKRLHRREKAYGLPSLDMSKISKSPLSFDELGSALNYKMGSRFSLPIANDGCLYSGTDDHRRKMLEIPAVQSKEAFHCLPEADVLSFFPFFYITRSTTSLPTSENSCHAHGSRTETQREILSSSASSLPASEDSCHAYGSRTKVQREMLFTQMPIGSSVVSHVPTMANPRFFAEKKIDHNGGEISLHDTGIKLVIFPGALPKGRTEYISVALMKNDPASFPPIHEKHSLVTPLILCGPHGLKFLEPALLVFPHCATTGDEPKKFKVLCSDTGDKEAMKWEELVEEDQKSSENFFFTTNGTSCFLYAPHFTGFGAEAEDGIKKISVVVYRQKNVGEQDDFPIRVYFVPGFASSRKEVAKQEAEMDGQLCDAERLLRFKSNGKGLLVSIESISEGWDCVLNADKQEMDFEEISKSSLNSPAPSCTFTLQHSNVQLRHVRCKIVVVQRETENAKPVTISVCAFIGQEEHGRYRKDSGIDSSSEALGERFIPPDLKRKLLQKLDIKHPVLNNWEMLAHEIGINKTEMDYLAHNQKITSPTECVLKRWEIQPDDGRGLRHLEDLLKKIGRPDAAELVKSYNGYTETAV